MLRPVLLLAVLSATLWAGEPQPLLIDLQPLKELLSPGNELFLPRSLGTASENSLLGVTTNINEELVFFDYPRGTLVLEASGFPSEKTLIRFFLDTLNRFTPTTIAPDQGWELSRPFQGGTLYFTRMKPNEAILLTDTRDTLILENPLGVYTSHLETGGDIFWLGNGQRYLSYNREGKLLSDFSLNDHTLLSDLSEGQNALFTMASINRLFLVLETGQILSLLGETHHESSGGYGLSTLDLASLFVEYHEKSLEFMKQFLPHRVISYNKWALRHVEDLYRIDPLNSELGLLMHQWKDFTLK